MTTPATLRSTAWLGRRAMEPRRGDPDPFDVTPPASPSARLEALPFFRPP
ncbi:MAG: hypothetical protein ACRYFW_08725 [Janthinobacterium lividum]